MDTSVAEFVSEVVNNAIKCSVSSAQHQRPPSEALIAELRKRGAHAEVSVLRGSLAFTRGNGPSNYYGRVLYVGIVPTVSETIPQVLLQVLLPMSGSGSAPHICGSDAVSVWGKDVALPHDVMSRLSSASHVTLRPATSTKWLSFGTLHHLPADCLMNIFAYYHPRSRPVRMYDEPIIMFDELLGTALRRSLVGQCYLQEAAPRESDEEQTNSARLYRDICIKHKGSHVRRVLLSSLWVPANDAEFETHLKDSKVLRDAVVANKERTPNVFLAPAPHGRHKHQPDDAWSAAMHALSCRAAEVSRGDGNTDTDEASLLAAIQAVDRVHTNDQDSFGLTLLHHAVKAGASGCVHLLVADRQADVRLRDVHDDTALHVAAAAKTRIKNCEIYQTLASRMAVVRVNRDRQGALHVALAARNVAAVEAWISHVRPDKSDGTMCDVHGCTLHDALRGYLDWLESNKKRNKIIAANDAKTALVKNVEKQTCSGATLVQRRIRTLTNIKNEHYKTNGINKQNTNDDAVGIWNPLHLAAMEGTQKQHVDDALERTGHNVFERYEMIRARDPQGMTPLHMAAARGAWDVLDALLEAFPDDTTRRNALSLFDEVDRTVIACAATARVTQRGSITNTISTIATNVSKLMKLIYHQPQQQDSLVADVLLRPHKNGMVDCLLEVMVRRGGGLASVAWECVQRLPSSAGRRVRTSIFTACVESGELELMGNILSHFEGEVTFEDNDACEQLVAAIIARRGTEHHLLRAVIDAGCPVTSKAFKYTVVNGKMNLKMLEVFLYYKVPVDVGTVTMVMKTAPRDEDGSAMLGRVVAALPSSDREDSRVLLQCYTGMCPASAKALLENDKADSWDQCAIARAALYGDQEAMEFLVSRLSKSLTPQGIELAMRARQHGLYELGKTEACARAGMAPVDLFRLLWGAFAALGKEGDAASLTHCINPIKYVRTNGDDDEDGNETQWSVPLCPKASCSQPNSLDIACRHNDVALVSAMCDVPHHPGEPGVYDVFAVEAGRHGWTSNVITLASNLPDGTAAAWLGHVLDNAVHHNQLETAATVLVISDMPQAQICAKIGAKAKTHAIAMVCNLIRDRSPPWQVRFLGNLLHLENIGKRHVAEVLHAVLSAWKSLKEQGRLAVVPNLPMSACTNTCGSLVLSMMSRAVRRGNIDHVKLLLESGATAAKHPDEHYSPVLYAIANNDLEMVKFLIRHGDDIGKAEGKTPEKRLEGCADLAIHAAAFESWRATSRLSGNLAILLAALTRSEEMLELVLHSTSPEKGYVLTSTPVHTKCRETIVEPDVEVHVVTMILSLSTKNISQIMEGCNLPTSCLVRRGDTSNETFVAWAEPACRRILEASPAKSDEHIDAILKMALHRQCYGLAKWIIASNPGHRVDNTYPLQVFNTTSVFRATALSLWMSVLSNDALSVDDVVLFTQHMTLPIRALTGEELDDAKYVTSHDFSKLFILHRPPNEVITILDHLQKLNEREAGELFVSSWLPSMLNLFATRIRSDPSGVIVPYLHKHIEAKTFEPTALKCVHVGLPLLPHHVLTEELVAVAITGLGGSYAVECISAFFQKQKDGSYTSSVLHIAAASAQNGQEPLQALLNLFKPEQPNIIALLYSCALGNRRFNIAQLLLDRYPDEVQGMGPTIEDDSMWWGNSLVLPCRGDDNLLTFLRLYAVFDEQAVKSLFIESQGRNKRSSVLNGRNDLYYELMKMGVVRVTTAELCRFVVADGCSGFAEALMKQYPDAVTITDGSPRESYDVLLEAVTRDLHGVVALCLEQLKGTIDLDKALMDALACKAYDSAQLLADAGGVMVMRTERVGDDSDEEEQENAKTATVETVELFPLALPSREAVRTMSKEEYLKIIKLYFTLSKVFSIDDAPRRREFYVPQGQPHSMPLPNGVSIRDVVPFLRTVDGYSGPSYFDNAKRQGKHEWMQKSLTFTERVEVALKMGNWDLAIGLIEVNKATVSATGAIQLALCCTPVRRAMFGVYNNMEKTKFLEDVRTGMYLEFLAGIGRLSDLEESANALGMDMAPCGRYVPMHVREDQSVFLSKLNLDLSSELPPLESIVKHNNVPTGYEDEDTDNTAMLTYPEHSASFKAFSHLQVTSKDCISVEDARRAIFRYKVHSDVRHLQHIIPGLVSDKCEITVCKSGDSTVELHDGDKDAKLIIVLNVDEGLAPNSNYTTLLEMVVDRTSWQLKKILETVLDTRAALPRVFCDTGCDVKLCSINKKAFDPVPPKERLALVQQLHTFITNSIGNAFEQTSRMTVSLSHKEWSMKFSKSDTEAHVVVGASPPPNNFGALARVAPTDTAQDTAEECPTRSERTQCSSFKSNYEDVQEKLRATRQTQTKARWGKVNPISKFDEPSTADAPFCSEFHPNAPQDVMPGEGYATHPRGLLHVGVGEFGAATMLSSWSHINKHFGIDNDGATNGATTLEQEQDGPFCRLYDELVDGRYVPKALLYNNDPSSSVDFYVRNHALSSLFGPAVFDRPLTKRDLNDVDSEFHDELRCQLESYDLTPHICMFADFNGEWVDKVIKNVDTLCNTSGRVGGISTHFHAMCLAPSRIGGHMGCYNNLRAGIGFSALLGSNDSTMTMFDFDAIHGRCGDMVSSEVRDPHFPFCYEPVVGVWYSRLATTVPDLSVGMLKMVPSDLKRCNVFVPYFSTSAFTPLCSVAPGRPRPDEMFACLESSPSSSSSSSTSSLLCNTSRVVPWLHRLQMSIRKSATFNTFVWQTMSERYNGHELDDFDELVRSVMDDYKAANRIIAETTQQ
eukprot:PhM_4_TR13275/c5_g1_i1/m.105693